MSNKIGHQVIVCNKDAQRLAVLEVGDIPKGDDWCFHAAAVFGKWMLDNLGNKMLAAHVAGGNYIVWVESVLKTEIMGNQVWAFTNPAGQSILSDLREGFLSSRDMGAIDAPSCLPSGSTIENVIVGTKSGSDGRYIIGGLIERPD